MEESYTLYEMFTKQAFTIPLWQVILLVVVSSVCLTRKMLRAGLTIAYFFLFYWGFVSNRPYFSEHLGGRRSDMFSTLSSAS